MNAVPLARVTTVVSRNPQPGVWTMAIPSKWAGFSNQSAMNSACRTPSPTVRYRAYWLICRRPASPPSLASFSKDGRTTVNNCMMMEAEIAGMIPSAKMVHWDSAAPLNRSMTANNAPPWVRAILSKNSARAWPLMPGVGM